MSEQFQKDVSSVRASDSIELFQPLPGWLANRLLRPGEEVTWVRGPRFNPPWECYVTHPALLLLAVAVSAAGVGLAWLIAGDRSDLLGTAFFAAGLLVVSTIIILGIANGHFTRLVATNFRLVILQGHEICRSWNIGDLPPPLLRYGRLGNQEHWQIDWDAVKNMLGNPSDQFTNAKAILSLGKQLDRIMIRDQDRR